MSARLRHPPPARRPTGAAWTFRATECDIADHVNNAAYWPPVEEELLAGRRARPSSTSSSSTASPAQPGAKRVLRAGAYRRWIVGDDGELHASVRPGAADVG